MPSHPSTHYARLNNGRYIPRVGLGTSRMGSDEQVIRAVKTGLELGYRHFDTSERYHNESAIGVALQEAIQSGQVTREELFITTKVWSNNHTEERALAQVKRSLTNLRLDYIDMVLIHWPFSFQIGDNQRPVGPDDKLIGADPKEANFIFAYKGLERAVQLGLVRAIGVSNFNKSQLKRLLESAQIKPAVNQVESHPFLTQRELLDFCTGHQIQLEAYSPLRRGDRNLLENATMRRIAATHKHSVAQIAIGWQVQRGVIVIPKSSTRERMCHNLDVFDFLLSAEEVEAIEALNSNNRLVNFGGAEYPLAASHLPEYPF